MKRPSLSDGLFLLFVLVETRVGHRVSKRGFRILRDAAQGSALRTRSLSRKAGESFIMGAVLISAIFFHPSCLSGFQGCLDVQHALVCAAAEAKFQTLLFLHESAIDQ